MIVHKKIFQGGKSKCVFDNLSSLYIFCLLVKRVKGTKALQNKTLRN